MIMQTAVPLTAIVERIHTGLNAPEQSRALVVFNQTDQPLSGIAVFHASMSWPCETPLPPVRVVDMAGEAVLTAVTPIVVGPDVKGRSDRRHLSFSLCFAVSDIPANGWRTYIAAYAETLSPALQDFVETLGLVVVETTRHGGDLLPLGCFADLPPGWVGNF